MNVLRFNILKQSIVLKNVCNKGQNVKLTNIFQRTRNCRYLTRESGIGHPEPMQSGSMAEVKLKMMKRLGLKTGYIQEAEKRDHLLKYTPKHEELPIRTMKNSFVEAYIPLSTSEDMQVNYVSMVGTVRLGRIMEDLDMFAVWICQQHVFLPNLPKDMPLPYTFVTVLVDKMIFSKLLPEYNQDIRLLGHVSWVGTTSLEIRVWLQQKHKERYRQITHAIFLMAARNATNTASAPVNPLKPTNEIEQQVFNAGEERRKARKLISERSIFKIKPNDKEHSLMYDLFQRTSDTSNLTLNYRISPANCNWMADSYIVNSFLSFPVNRNAHNNVFGGFLMRQSYEISFLAAYLYCRHRPSCESCSDITFNKPVTMNSLIKMIAYIVYTEDKFMQIMTVTHILDPTGQSPKTTNVFHYTFSAPDNVIEVLPKTYHETMWYINGRRHFYSAMNKKD